jgi:hypothetical protein
LVSIVFNWKTKPQPQIYTDLRGLKKSVKIRETPHWRAAQVSVAKKWLIVSCPVKTGEPSSKIACLPWFGIF